MMTQSSQVTKRRAEEDSDKSLSGASHVVNRKPVAATPGKVYVRLLPPIATANVDAEEEECKDKAWCFLEYGVDIRDFEEAFSYCRRKSSDTFLIDDTDGDGEEVSLLSLPASSSLCSSCMRDRMSRRMKLSMTMSLGSAYPAGAGGPLTQQEHRAHLICLFACIVLDLLLLRGLLYDLSIRHMGYTWLQVCGGFACYSIVVTAVVYLVKVKVPQCMQPAEEQVITAVDRRRVCLV